MAQKSLAMVLLAAVATSALASLQDACNGQVCEEGIPASGSAMLQVKSEPAKAGTDDHDDDAGFHSQMKKTGHCEPMHLQAVHLEESRVCIPAKLQEMHLKAVRRHAALLAARSQQPGQPGFPPSLEDLTTTTTPAPTTPPPVDLKPAPSASASSAPISIAPEASASSAPISVAPPASASSAPVDIEETPAAPTGASGEDVTLDAAGFKEATSLCCPQEMEVFFNRVLASKGYEACSMPHIQGLMHWFTCVPDMDFQYMLDVIEEGNPCKYWTKTGEACPELSETCAGEFCR